MLSNPSPESSVGKFLSARNSIASRSRIVFVYSALFKRRALRRPGSGFILASARAHFSRVHVLQDQLPSIAIGRKRVNGFLVEDYDNPGEIRGVVALAAGVCE